MTIDRCTPALVIGLMFASLTAPVMKAQAPFASATRADSISLREAVQSARAQSPLFAAAIARRDISLAQARETAQWPNPTFEWRRENLGSPLQPDIFATAYVPFDLSGRRLALRGAATAQRARALASAAIEQHDFDLRVAQAWIRLGSAQEAAGILRTQAESFDELLRIEQARVREGVSPEASLARMTLEIERSRVATLQAMLELRRARSDLAALIGRSAHTELAAAAYDGRSLPTVLDASMIEAVALRQREEVAAMNAAVRESELRARAERRGMIGGDWQLQAGSKETGGFMTGQLGFAVPVPLFNRNDGARARAEAEARLARAHRDATLVHLRAEVYAAWSMYAQYSEGQFAASALAQASAVDTSMRTAWQEGHATLLELFDALRTATESRLLQARIRAEGLQARYQLERAMSARLDENSPFDFPLVSAVLPPPPPESR